MPDPTLDAQLEQARTDLFASIRLPELAEVQTRAAVIRRRRRGLTVGTSALALLLVVLLGATWINGGGPTNTPDPAASSDGRLRWSGRDITLYGLTSTVLDQPGNLVDVQFAADNTGYALTEDCGQGPDACTIRLAFATDVEQTWADWPLPLDGAPAGSARLVALNDGVIVHTDGEAWLGTNKDRTWIRVTVNDAPAAIVDSGARLTLEPNSCGGSLTVWRLDATAAQLAKAPPMIACSVTDGLGALWVGGRTADGTAPAVAVSRDAGATWQVTGFPAGQGVASVAPVPGAGVDAVIRVPRGGDPYPQTETVTAVYASDGVGGFHPRPTDAGALIGDLVPLGDGWLLAAGPDWQLNSPDGGDWSRAGGSLPWVGRIAAIRGGWVAYDLFKAGWAAWSSNGLVWQKINVR